jgi:acyl-CoA synthetase (AMP-forming)/AMP-acid ligase II
MQQELRADHTDVVLQKTPLTFDVSACEIFSALIAGACLTILPPRSHKDPIYVSQAIKLMDVTRAHFVPSMLQAFLEVSPNVTSLRHVLCSGEELPPLLVERFFEKFPMVQLHNLYGPTEASVEVTYWRCEPSGFNGRVLIGRPIANTQIYILDRNQRPVGVGIHGEIYIGGVGLARGYVNRPDFTAERFVANPFGMPGSRLYKSGDVGRFLPDGNIEFLGRNDDQVKIRGFRIETGEIEAVLLKHPAVRRAIVQVREDAPGHRRLIAYCLTDQAMRVDAGILRSYIGERLPDYMVPSAVVILDAVPLTESGKVDHRRLPTPDRSRESLCTSYVAPRTCIEQALAEIWSEVLNVPRVGIHDNFFDLGGHSLLAASLIARQRVAVEIGVSLQDLFFSPTIASLIERATRRESLT